MPQRTVVNLLTFRHPSGSLKELERVILTRGYAKIVFLRRQKPDDFL